jgi:hypothetical protein
MTQLNVFPVRLESKAPAVKDWRKRAQPRELWDQDPDASWDDWSRWGAPAGPENGWWVLDVDPRHGGEASLEALQQLYGRLPKTYVVRTPSGGWHLYWRWVGACAELTNTAGKLGPGLDIRAEGGMVLVPPTPGYETMSNCDPADAPAWLLALLMPAPKVRASAGSEGDGEAPIRNPRQWGGRAIQSALEEIKAAPEGSRDATMNRNAYGLGRVVVACGLDRDKVVELLVDAAIAAGYDPAKALDCCNRAVDAGMQNPRTVAAVNVPAVDAVPAGATGDQMVPPADAPLRPCPPKPGPEPKDIGGAAWTAWSRVRDAYAAWQRDVRDVLNARLVVILYDQTRVLYRRHGLRRVELLGTADHQAGSIIHIGEQHGFLISAGQASTLAEEYLRMSTGRVITEHPTLWDTGAGLYRWEQPKVEEGPTPTWDTFLSRLTDADAFLAHVWAIFEPSYKGRQALWLQGDGNDGKSIAMTALFAGAGCPFATVSDADLVGGNQFLFSSLWDKPAVLVNESKNVNVLMSGMIHKLTGRDPVSVEYKHGQRFAARFNGCVLVTSNNLPQIEGTRANVSRLSVVRIRQGGWVDDLESRLRREVPALLHRAAARYTALCPQHFAIALNDESKELLGTATAAEDEAHSSALRLCGLKLDGNDFMPRSEIVSRLRAAGFRFQAGELASFYRWLKAAGAREHKADGVRGYLGVKQ